MPATAAALRQFDRPGPLRRTCSGANAGQRSATRHRPDAPRAHPPSTRSDPVLDGVVLSAELTVISIIQGIALYFLTSSIIAALDSGRVLSLVQGAAGLVVLCTIWSRWVLHIFAAIGWLLSLGASGP